MRVGGAYRYVWRNKVSGAEMAAGGVYSEIVTPERLVQTERFDDPWYPSESLVTTELHERNGKTSMTVTLLYESREARNGVLEYPMEGGVAMSYDRLEALLASLESRWWWRHSARTGHLPAAAAMIVRVAWRSRRQRGDLAGVAEKAHEGGWSRAGSAGRGGRDAPPTPALPTLRGGRVKRGGRSRT